MQIQKQIANYPGQYSSEALKEDSRLLFHLPPLQCWECDSHDCFADLDLNFSVCQPWRGAAKQLPWHKRTLQHVLKNPWFISEEFRRMLTEALKFVFFVFGLVVFGSKRAPLGSGSKLSTHFREGSVWSSPWQCFVEFYNNNYPVLTGHSS